MIHKLIAFIAVIGMIGALTALFDGYHPASAVTATVRDAEKIKRLRLEQSVAQLAVNHWHRELRPYALSNDPPTGLLDSLGAARVRLDLANRAVNRFMGCASEPLR